MSSQEWVKLDDEVPVVVRGGRCVPYNETGFIATTSKRKLQTKNNDKIAGIYFFGLSEKKWRLFMEYPKSIKSASNVSPYYEHATNSLYIFYTTGQFPKYKGQFLCVNMENKKYSIFEIKKGADKPTEGIHFSHRE